MLENLGEVLLLVFKKKNHMIYIIQKTAQLIWDMGDYQINSRYWYLDVLKNNNTVGTYQIRSPTN